jgi:hypothetical protein
MEQYKTGSVSDETFDDFLAEHGLLQSCKDHTVTHKESAPPVSWQGTLVTNHPE